MKTYERDEIFSGIRQVDWYIGSMKIQYPVFFREASSFGALFPARISEIRRLLPDIRFSPARILPGIGLISLNAIEFSDMGFHDLSMAVVLNSPLLPRIPLFNVLSQVLNRNTYIYVLNQLVTTENASILLSQWSNIPTPVVSVAYSRGQDRVVCEAREDDELICTLRGRRIPADRSDLMKWFCHYYENAQPQSWEFKVGALEHGFSFGPKNIELEVGLRHPIARELSRVLLSRRALMYLYIPKAQAILYGQERLQPSNLKSMMQERLGFQVSEKVLTPGTTMERRSYTRNCVDLPAEIVGMKKGHKIHEGVHVINLSEGGMYVKSDIPLDLGTDVSANIQAVRPDNTFWARGKVIRNEEHAMAIQFIQSYHNENDETLPH